MMYLSNDKFSVGIWDMLYFPLLGVKRIISRKMFLFLGLRGSYSRIFPELS